MKILVTGAKGQLGSEIRELAAKYGVHRFEFTDVEELDITSEKAVREYLNENKFDCVINCAAYTAVDKAEGDKEKALLINATAVRNLARVSRELGAFLVHISTDFVFDGKANAPYTEKDKAAPLSVYGKTKLEGEKEFLKNAGQGMIVRTGWLYSSFGNNFVKTVLRLAREKGKIGMIFDQVGTPTYAADLAKAILEALSKLQKGKKEIYQFSNEGVASWYDFAKAVCEIGGVACVVHPIETREYPTPAMRPKYSVMNKAKFKKEFGQEIPYWRDSLKLCLSKLKGSHHA
jgi:dTDP-4-dehydrorhamnose reductase